MRVDAHSVKLFWGASVAFFYYAKKAKPAGIASHRLRDGRLARQSIL
jgi:hypothetical protein